MASCIGLASTVVLCEPPPSPRAALVVARLSGSLLGALGCSPEAAAAMQQGGKPASQLAAAVRRCGVISAAAIGLCPSLEILVSEAWLYERRRLALPERMLPAAQAEVLVRRMPALVAHQLVESAVLVALQLGSPAFSGRSAGS